MKINKYMHSYDNKNVGINFIKKTIYLFIHGNWIYFVGHCDKILPLKNVFES